MSTDTLTQINYPLEIAAAERSIAAAEREARSGSALALFTVQARRQRLEHLQAAAARGPLYASPAAPTGPRPLPANEHQVLAAVALGVPQLASMLEAQVNTKRKAAGMKVLGVTVIVAQLQMRGILTGSGKKDLVALTEYGHQLLALGAAA